VQSELSDATIVARVLAGETALFELIMRRYNRRLFRLARAVLREDAEAEDALQDAYVQAYLNLGQFAGRAQFSTWLTRIVLNQALRRARQRGRLAALDGGAAAREGSFVDAPEQRAAQSELRQALESAVDELPEVYRTTFVLRDIEGLDTAETADCLGIPGETVKTRLHRARALLRVSLTERLGEVARDAFSFAGERCDRVVHRVLARLPAADATR
jgi:RNA polymerase sigma-70 factor (ECF subfamily)